MEVEIGVSNAASIFLSKDELMSMYKEVLPRETKKKIIQKSICVYSNDENYMIIKFFKKSKKQIVINVGNEELKKMEKELPRKDMSFGRISLAETICYFINKELEN